MEPGLTLHVVRVQDYEKRQLELVRKFLTFAVLV